MSKRALDQDRRAKALYHWLMTEGRDAVSEAVEIYLGPEKLEPNEWYICNGKVIIDVLHAKKETHS